MAAALALEKGESPDTFKTELETRARTIRHDIYKHLKKHEQEYKEWYQPEIQGDETIEAGTVPSTWNDFLESTLRKGRWICGLSLLAMSKRYGCLIVVVPPPGNTKDKPMAFGTPRAGKPPIVLLLEAGHYKLAQLKPGRQWPNEWIGAEQASITNKLLRGGGKISWRPDATPSPGKSRERSWRPPCTPSCIAPSDNPGTLLPSLGTYKSRRTPSVHTLQSIAQTDPQNRACSKSIAGMSSMQMQDSTSRAPRNTRDRLKAKFETINSMQMQPENRGNGLHIHPGTLNPKGGFPFNCQLCKQQVSYPTVSCCSENISKNKQCQKDISKKGRKQTWKSILAKANKLAADAKARLIKTIKAQKAEIRLQQRQRQKQVAVEAASRPDPLKGLPVFPKSPISLWWKCPWCEFSIQTNVQKASRCRFKKQHLEREHGQQNFKLPRGNLLENPTRFVNAKATFQKRWESFHHVFQQSRWKGAHDIPLEHVYCRVYTNKRGMPVQVPIHQCVACSRHVSRPSLATSVCPKVAGKPASIAKRKQVWKQCRKRALLESSLGHTNSPKRKKLQGLQGIRVGEASHPGPGSFNVWSQNIRAWHAHGSDMVKEAQKAEVQLVFVQEHNLSAISMPSVTNTCKREQWNSLFVPKPSSNNGGVAILCRDSFAMTEVQRIRRESGQLLHAVVHGGQRDIHVMCIYRHHTDDCFQMLREAETIINSFGSQDWILALDANADMTKGPAHDIFVGMGGVQCAVARHIRSVHPIDAIWASGGLPSMSHAELSGEGDHSIAQCVFPFQFQKCNRPLWRFSRTYSEGSG